MKTYKELNEKIDRQYTADYTLSKSGRKVHRTPLVDKDAEKVDEEKNIEVTMKSGHKFTAPIKVSSKDWHIVKHPTSGKQYRVDHKGNTLEESDTKQEHDLGYAHASQGKKSNPYNPGSASHAAYEAGHEAHKRHFGEATETHELGIDHDEPISRHEHIKAVIAKHGGKISGQSDKSTYVHFPADKVEAAKRELKAGRVHADHWVNGDFKEEFMAEESGAYEKSEENKRSADAAKKQGDMFAHHLHMSDYHDNLAQWHSEKGRHSVADSHAKKSEEHHEKAMGLKEQAPVAPSIGVHRIAVTTSEPDHPAVSKRDETTQRFVRVTAHDKDKAIEQGMKHFKKKGFKVHGAEHVGMVHESYHDNRRGFGRREREDDEYHVPDPTVKNKVKKVQEVLSPEMGAGEYIKDFQKSDAPQFKGKSQEKRRMMGIAAYMAAKKDMKEEAELNEGTADELGNKIDNAKSTEHAKSIIAKAPTKHLQYLHHWNMGLSGARTHKDMPHIKAELTKRKSLLSSAESSKRFDEEVILDEANHREFASQGKMHPDMAKHMKVGQEMDYYEHGTGDKVSGKVMKNDGKEVHIKQTHDSYDPKKKGTVHKFTVASKLDEAKKDDVPFDPPYKKAEGNVKDKSGAVHTPMSRARDLARQAMKKQYKEELNLDLSDEEADSLMLEALTGQQHKIDKNKNGKVDSHDFKILRGEVCPECGKSPCECGTFKESGEFETRSLSFNDFMSQLNEYTPGPGGITRVQGRSYGAQYHDPEGDDDADDKKKQVAKSEPAVKRGRGRPAGSKSGANQKVTTGRKGSGVDYTGYKLHLPNTNR